MEVVAESHFVRVAPRKVRLVADLVRGMKAQEAALVLKNLNKSAAMPLLLTIKQGISNAAHNFQLDKGNLVVKTVEIGEGPTLKRGQPVSRGRWHPIMKRTSHLRVILTGEKVVLKETKKNEKKEVASKNGTKN